MNVDLRDLRWALVAAQHRSLRQAAEALGVRQSTLSRKRADVSASVTVLGRIADALEVEATELVRAVPSKARQKAAEPHTA